MSAINTLACNATSVQSTDPVAWGLISFAVTALCVIYNYGFWVTTFAKMWSPVNTFWTSKRNFFGCDVVFFNFIFYMGGIALLAVALANYAAQNPSTNPSAKFPRSPQDVANVVYLTFAMWVLTYHKFYQLSQYDKASEEGKLDIGRIGNWDAFFAVFMPMAAFMGICLFGGIYGYQQTNAGVVTDCSGTALSAWFPRSGPGAYYGSNVGLAHLSTGILLAVALFAHFIMYYDANGNVVYVGGKQKSMGDFHRMFVSYQSNVFDVVNSPKQKRSVLAGWLPTLQLGFWWTMAFSWFFAQSHIYTHYDLYKVLGVYFCTSFLALVLSAYSGSLDCFTAFFFAAVFCFELIQYTAAAILQPPTGEVPLPQKTTDFGLFLTGPATNANVDIATVTVFTYIGLTLATMACIAEGVGWSKSTVSV